MKKPTILDGVEKPADLMAPDGTECLEYSNTDDPRVVGTTGGLACWRPAGHEGPHWDDMDKLAWEVPS